MTGQKYESYYVDVEDGPLRNNTMFKKGDNDDTMESEDDEFDDQFEEDVQEKKKLKNIFVQQYLLGEKNSDESDDFDLSSSRWVAYDTLGTMLDR